MSHPNISSYCELSNFLDIKMMKKFQNGPFDCCCQNYTKITQTAGKIFINLLIAGFLLKIFEKLPQLNETIS